MAIYYLDQVRIRVLTAHFKSSLPEFGPTLGTQI